MIVLSHWNAQGAVFEDLQGEAHALTPADLLELAVEGRDPSSGQRLPGFAARLVTARIVAVEADAGDGWRFVLDDRRSFNVAREAVAEACEPPLWHVPRAPWSGDQAARLPVHDHEAVMTDGEALRACLLAVAQHGFARIGGAPVQVGEVERIIARFGPLRETNYGRAYDVRVKPAHNNLADTAMALPPHTDNPYRANPPDLQVLHCLAAAGAGGDSVLVDGLAAVARLRDIAPESFALLALQPVQFAWHNSETHLRASAPVIELDAKGELARLRHNQRSMDAIPDADPDMRTAWRTAFQQLQSCIDDPAFAFSFRLEPGDMLIFDNRRILHGRTEFSGTDVPGDVERHLQGAYADADGLYSKLFSLTQARAAAQVAALGALFDSAAMDDPYGEDMSIRDHMLQSAELAFSRRLGAATMTAALLHDIGWALGDGVPGAEHEHLGADRVMPLFGPEIGEPIRHHVAAKRYLVATQPDYEAYLSDASRHTLAKQGGPMSAAECAQFAAEPAFDAALLLRSLDDAGKDLHQPSTGFSSYAPLLSRQMIRHMLLAPAR